MKTVAIQAVYVLANKREKKTKTQNYCCKQSYYL